MIRCGGAPDEELLESMGTWMEEMGRRLVQPAVSSLNLPMQAVKDTLYYEIPRTVMRYPVTMEQQPYEIEAGPLKYRKEVTGRENFKLSNRIFNTFVIKNTMLDSAWSPYQYTDYMTEIGLVKRTSRGKLIQTNVRGDSLGEFIFRTESELTGYRVK